MNNLSESEFNSKVDKLRQTIEYKNIPLSIGQHWLERLDDNKEFENLLSIVDKNMYKDKQRYYHGLSIDCKQI